MKKNPCPAKVIITFFIFSLVTLTSGYHDLTQWTDNSLNSYPTLTNWNMLSQQNNYFSCSKSSILISRECMHDICPAEGVCWTRTAERQTSRMRTEYLKSFLRQEVGYFDKQTDSSSTFQVIATITSDAQNNPRYHSW